MPIIAVETMSEQPGTCMACGNSGLVDGEIQHPIVEMQGIDINWGDTPYLCAECVNVVCDLAERVTQKDHEDVIAERDHLSEQLTQLQEEHQSLQNRVTRMLDGRKAIKEQKEAVGANG